MNHLLSIPPGTTWRDLRTPAIASLVLTNLVPLAGVLFLGWNAGLIVVLYWCETAVIGLYSILKLPFALRWFALLAAPFFMLHFGAFLAVTGLISVGLYAITNGVPGLPWEVLASIRGELTVFVPLVAVSHGVSFVTNFIGKKEYLSQNDTDVLMAAPYMRVFAMIALVFLGAFAMGLTGAPAALMAVFVALKIVLDAIAHLREHTTVDRAAG